MTPCQSREKVFRFALEDPSRYAKLVQDLLWLQPSQSRFPKSKKQSSGGNVLTLAKAGALWYELSPTLKLTVIWQSLVVKSYRSFFKYLDKRGIRTLSHPSIMELGFQNILRTLRRE